MMIIRTLMENTARFDQLTCEHGLSLYLETGGYRILFDTGASPAFVDNARRMDLDLSQIDFVVISHGHYDHGGGLQAFLDLNLEARVFIHPAAFGNYQARSGDGSLRYIGIDPALRDHRQIVFTGDACNLAPGIRLFSGVPETVPLPASNRDLLKESGQEWADDDFVHEQNLIIEEGDRTFLLTGCAHRGIVNIVRHFHQLEGRYPDRVIGGFHLAKSDEDRESDQVIRQTAEYLLASGARYLTCHCTGLVPYQELKRHMGDRIGYLAAGDILEL